MNTELLEALDILEKEKNISKTKNLFFRFGLSFLFPLKLFKFYFCYFFFLVYFILLFSVLSQLKINDTFIRRGFTACCCLKNGQTASEKAPKNSRNTWLSKPVMTENFVSATVTVIIVVKISSLKFLTLIIIPKIN